MVWFHEYFAFRNQKAVNVDLLHEISVRECSSMKDTGLANRAAVYPLSSLAPVHTLYFDPFGIVSSGA